MMRFANILLHCLHLGTIGFTLVGWMVPATRPAHLVLCALILGSWFILGPLMRKPGMCLITEIQQGLWRRLGAPHAQQAYMPYLLKRITGRAFREDRVNRATQWSLYLATLAGLLTSWLTD